ncbi:MAG: acyl-CoA dehydrogenase [Candidatus Nanopelagicales bacterium]|nr:acyl-CoA dehydrogenase [Candidatus Nanopelagicales bacterium]
MSHYKSNLRDLEFNLFEVFGVEDRLGRGVFEDVDVDIAKEFLHQADELARGPLSDCFASCDRNPPVYDPKDCSVTMPDEFKAAYRALMDAEGWRLELPEELGGIASPPSLRWAVAELILGSNPPAFMFMSGPGFAAILHALGNEQQKHMASLMVDLGWGATMVLTEPDAGSDVGAGRAKAFLNDDGTYRIEGVKRFITSGEHDLSENIIHLVLARPEGVEGAGGPGTKGLSLFVVPKFLFDLETGELGERNGVYATNLEKKMGLKVSTTCELTFGDKEPAIGYLVGDVHQGIAQMFQVIEYARMMVGTKAIATLSTGYLNCLEYAEQRVQGAKLAEMLDKTAPRVTIINHPDVRRSLMLQKSYAEGMRALVQYTATWQDQISAARLGEADIDVDLAERMNDLLLPIVKGVGSERSYELLAVALQTLGGSGYLQDYPIEQYIRDAKIDTLYEGTTAIQGLDFFFRKMVRDQFKAVFHLASQITDTVKGGGAQDSLSRERELLGSALEDVQLTIGKLGEWAMASQTDIQQINLVGLNTTRLLMMAGDLVIGWLLVRQAEVAQAALAGDPSPSDRDFYTGKVAAARWFCSNRLPLLAAEREVTQGTDLGIMELPEGAF